ncbi:MAG: 2OG-Fe(II) oxygenase [Limnospira sp.]
MAQDCRRNDGNAIAPDHRLTGLVGQSLDVIEAALNDPELPPRDRAEMALKVLELADRPSSLKSSKISEILSPNFVQIDNFLSLEEEEETLKLAFENRDRFFSSGVVNKDKDTRKSSVLLLQNFDEFYQKLRFKILQIRPEILEKLNLPSFLVSWVEMQMTAHNDGEYYHIHQDVDGDKIANRVVTYVYYFYREPKAFYGGDLRLYETHIDGDKTGIGETFKTVEPRHNSIVFFDSRFKHEVLPVYCPSRQFEDGRFTINGWIHR